MWNTPAVRLRNTPAVDWGRCDGGRRPPLLLLFAPGTEVWTLTGRRLIEKIRSGDRVLAQDVESGELAYKPVLAVTLRLPGPRMRIGLGGETIIATPSHPFWVVGQGWRMTKQLAVGNCLHTPSGGVRVESIEKLATDHSFRGFAYNLIVADFDSYFVGQRGSWFTTTRPAGLPRPSCPALSPTRRQPTHNLRFPSPFAPRKFAPCGEIATKDRFFRGAKGDPRSLVGRHCLPPLSRNSVFGSGASTR